MRRMRRIFYATKALFEQFRKDLSALFAINVAYLLKLW